MSVSRSIAGTLSIAAEPLDNAIYRLSVEIANTTPDTADVTNRHDAIAAQAFVSTHTILRMQQGDFISLLDPPGAYIAAAQACRNQHTWPVLIGAAGATDTMLSSPMIMYDYPQIAAESVGPLFDGLEIDEILTLRILTLTDDEKAEIRRGDARGRELLERTEALTNEQLMQLHGTVRRLQPVEEAQHG